MILGYLQLEEIALNPYAMRKRCGRGDYLSLNETVLHGVRVDDTKFL
jgi:hypothetical protein